MLLLPIQECKNVTTGIFKKNMSIYSISFKIKFQSLPFFTWAATHYI